MIKSLHLPHRVRAHETLHFEVGNPDLTKRTIGVTVLEVSVARRLLPPHSSLLLVMTIHILVDLLESISAPRGQGKLTLHLQARHLLGLLASQSSRQGLSIGPRQRISQSLLFDLDIPANHPQLDRTVHVLVPLIIHILLFLILLLNIVMLDGSHLPWLVA